jgi:hypothetical protein
VAIIDKEKYMLISLMELYLLNLLYIKEEGQF